MSNFYVQIKTACMVFAHISQLCVFQGIEEWFRPTASTGSIVTVTWMGACDDRWRIISAHSNEVRLYNHRNRHMDISMQEFMIDTASYNELLVCTCINTCTHSWHYSYMYQCMHNICIDTKFRGKSNNFQILLPPKLACQLSVCMFLIPNS